MRETPTRPLHAHLPAEVIERLDREARRARRSRTAQLVVILEKALGMEPAEPTPSPVPA